MIASVTFEKTDLQRRAVQVRSGHAEYRRRRRVWRGDRLPDGDRSRAQRWRTKTICSRTRPRACARFPAQRIFGQAREQDRRAVVPAGRRASARRRHHSRSRRGRRPDRTALRPADHGSVRHYRRPSAHRSAIYNTREEIDVLVARTRAGARGVLPDVRPERSLPGSHPRPQQAAEELPDDRGAEPPRRGLQSALRRSAEPVRARSTAM